MATANPNPSPSITLGNTNGPLEGGQQQQRREVEPPQSVLKLVQCPVCYKIPSETPIYGCINGHIICESCKEKVNHCSVCRADKFDVRNLTVEELLKGPNIECEYCNEGPFTGEEYKKHLNECYCRPVECNCKLKNECIAQMVPKEEYLDHMRHSHGMKTLPSDNVEVTAYVHMYGGFSPTLFKAFGQDFLLQSHRAHTEFVTWVAACEEMTARIYIQIKLFFDQITMEEGTNRQKLVRREIPSARALSPHEIFHTPEQVIKSGHLLRVREENGSNILLPPHVWPGYVVARGEGVPNWGYEIKMWKQNGSTHQARGREHSRVIQPYYTTDRARRLPARSVNRGLAPPPGSNEYYDDDDDDDEDFQMQDQQLQAALLQMQQQIQQLQQPDQQQGGQGQQQQQVRLSVAPPAPAAQISGMSVRASSSSNLPRAVVVVAPIQPIQLDQNAQDPHANESSDDSNSSELEVSPSSSSSSSDTDNNSNNGPGPVVKRGRLEEQEDDYVSANSEDDLWH